MKIKLTESKLKQIVAESVKKVLCEGNTVNNKPYFYSHGWEKIKYLMDGGLQIILT